MSRSGGEANEIDAAWAEGAIWGPMAEPTRTDVAAMGACSPIVVRWSRLDVSGLEHLPESGPVLLAGNHASYWDPVAVGVAALQRRQVCAFATSSMWKLKGLNTT